MADESWRHLYEKNNFCHPVTLAWFSIQVFVNSTIFKLSLNLSLMHLRVQIACYELKGYLSPKMLEPIVDHVIFCLAINKGCMQKV